MDMGGRMRGGGTRYLDMGEMVSRSAWQVDSASFSPERAGILDVCRIPSSVAELAETIGLPLGVVRVLLDDLLYENLIEVMKSAPRGGVVTDQRLLSNALGRRSRTPHRLVR